MNSETTASGADYFRRGLRTALYLFAIWSLVGTAFAVMAYAPSVADGRPFPISWWLHWGWMLVQHYVWVALTPILMLLVRRAPIDRRHWARSIIIYLPAAVIFPAAWAAIFTSIYWWVGAPFIGPTPGSHAEFFRGVLFSRFPSQLLLFATTLMVLLVIDYYRKYREREYRLAEAQLMALRAQLHPHFLFNTLNVISELIYRDPEAAERAITQLSELLRFSLTRDGAHEITLGEELEFLRKYVSMHRLLAGERLTVEWRIDGQLLGAAVPAMIFQPLVENSFRHGVAAQSGPGLIEVAAALDGPMLRLSVRDNGPGLPPDFPSASAGIGLANTRARLSHLYGGRQRLDLVNLPGGGLLASVTIPFREVATEEGYESSYAYR